MNDQPINQDSNNGAPVSNDASLVPIAQSPSSPATGPTVNPYHSSLTNQQTVPVSRALVTTPDGAADSDLIEKEWVTKAKQIVEHTNEDPFKQQQELSRIKADYMKKRYNKDIGSA